MTAPASEWTLVGSDLVRRGFEENLEGWRRAGLGAVDPAALRATSGRGGAVALAIPGGRAWIKPYRHGGVLRALLGDVYWDRPPRPVGEMRALLAARRAGIVAPEPLAAIIAPLAGPVGALLHRGALVTREIPGRCTLAEALCAAGHPGERVGLLACAWRVIGRLHAAGIRHRDLNATNLLVGGPDEEVAVIDFDGAVVGRGEVGAIGRAFARRRLARSVAKLSLPGLDRSAVAALLRDGSEGSP